MAKPNSQFEELARQAAENVETARAAGEQLTFLPDEPEPGESDRAKRGKGRVNSQLREWLATKGFRLPEDVLVEMAGMASTQDAFMTALARTEQLLTWAEAGATGYKGSPVKPSMAQRLAAFQFVFTAQLRAAEALMPFGMAKVGGDVAPQQVVQVVMPAPPALPADRGAAARDITPPRIDARMLPADMAYEIEQKQAVSESGSDDPDAESRTE